MASLARADWEIQLFPTAGNQAVCPDTPLKIRFSEAPKLGSAGKITVFKALDNRVVETIDIAAPTKKQSIGGVPNFNYYPVIIDGNEADVYLPNGAMAYGSAYYVTIDPGVFKVGAKDFAGFSKPAMSWMQST